MAVKKIKKAPAKKLSRSQRKKIARRNKAAGSLHETEEVNRHKRYFHNLATSRFCNQVRDGCGIDLANKEEAKYGRFPLEVSCKTSASSVSFQSVLDNMDGDGIRVLLFKKTAKSEGGKFMVKGEYSIMYRDGYEQFLQHVYAIQLLRLRQPELIQKLEEEFHLQLLDVPQQIQTTYVDTDTKDGPCEGSTQ